jgi:hypothetical protein
MWKKRIAVLLTAAMFSLTSALPAWAANVSANCYTGGYFITYGTADNWQDHTHDGLLWHTWYYDRQYKSKNWGWETGPETGTVNGPNLSSPGAVCPL